MAIDQYDFIEVPGNDRSSDRRYNGGIKIPIVKRQDVHDDSSGAVIPDWMVQIEGAQTESTIANFPTFTELFGWYCESSRQVTRDASNNFYTSSTLWHSNVYLVVQNGLHNSYIKHAVADGIITNSITIVRLVRVGQDAQIMQELSFQSCHWATVQSYLDWTIASFTPCVRMNTVNSFDQKTGTPTGLNSCGVDYTTNEVA